LLRNIDGVRYIPEFDGLRGVAITMVVLFHTVHLPGGYLGVDIFFVLSGFLITRLLIVEHERTGTISIGRFYLRRALRLMPALWFMIATVLIISTITGLGRNFNANTGTSLVALLYLENWLLAEFPQTGNIFQHTWSLAVEEQFYLVAAPILLLLLPRLSVARLSMMFVAMLIGAAAWRVALWIDGASALRILLGSDTRMDELLGGAIAAAILSVDGWKDRYASLVGEQAAWAGITICAAMVFAQQDSAVGLLIWQPAILYASAIIVSALALGLRRNLFRWLAWHPLVYTGAISYGIYLWHDALNWMVGASPYGGSWAVRLLFAGGGGFCIAALSFKHIERPIRSLAPRSVAVP
jgi:peptidoglycan/LPS O-acetylase OafA/YrhL